MRLIGLVVLKAIFLKKMQFQIFQHNFYSKNFAVTSQNSAGQLIRRLRLRVLEKAFNERILNVTNWAVYGELNKNLAGFNNEVLYRVLLVCCRIRLKILDWQASTLKTWPCEGIFAIMRNACTNFEI